MATIYICTAPCAESRHKINPNRSEIMRPLVAPMFLSRSLCRAVLVRQRKILSPIKAAAILRCSSHLNHIVPQPLRATYYHTSICRMAVHNLAETGFGTGTNELYDRARPSYQPYVLAHIREQVRDQPPLNVVELGSGTGLFTRALLAHPDWSSTINALRAVEPSQGMRDEFSKKTKDERVTTSDGTFTTTNVEDGWADIIIIAQAYHWCPDYDAASAEFARILKPNGIVAYVWNLEDRDGAPWVAQLRDLYEKHEAGTPQYRLGLWKATWDTPSYKKFFNPPEPKSWSYHLLGSLQICTDRAMSKSYMAILPEDKKAEAINGIKSIIEKGEGMKYVDEKAGIFEYPYKTDVIIARKK